MKTIACCLRDDVPANELPSMFERQGFECEIFRDETALMRALRYRGGIDLILVDMGNEVSVEDGLVSWLNCRMGEDVPVVLMSSHWSAQRVAAALEAGADDYVAKPFDNAELLARVKAVLRRSGSADLSRTRIELGGIVLDKLECAVTDCGNPVDLTPREFALAWLLFSNPGARLSREAISLAIWGMNKDIANRAIEQHVYKLRKKMNLCSTRGIAIRTTYSQGYRLDLSEERFDARPRAAFRAQELALM